MHITPGKKQAEMIEENKGLQIFDMAQPAFIEDGRVYVPLRLISQAFGITVQWDKNSFTVNILTSVSSTGPVVKSETKYTSIPALWLIVKSIPGYRVDTNESIYYSKNNNLIDDIRVEVAGQDIFCVEVKTWSDPEVLGVFELTLQSFLGEREGTKAFDYIKSLPSGASVQETFACQPITISRSDVTTVIVPLDL